MSSLSGIDRAMIIVGLTGGIASGKSLVSSYLKDQGIPVVDADLVAREVVKPGSPALKQIVSRFGPTILKEDGSLNRRAMGKIVFKEPSELAFLNHLLQPLIRQAINEKIKNASKNEQRLLVLDVPLLFEQGYDNICDQVMVVFVDRITQIKRLMKRNGYSQSEAVSRIQTQLPLATKIKFADIVINNNGSPEATKKQVIEWLKSYE